MRALKHRFKHRACVQKVVIEVIADVAMVAIGLVVAYYLKILFF